MTAPKQRLLITGASGFLGWNLCVVARESYNVSGTAFSNNPEIRGVTIHNVDLRRKINVQKLLDEVNPDIVIHAAATSSPNYCEKNPKESYETNVEATEILATLCAEKHIRLLFTSTDMVFDGKKSPFSETSQTHPLNVYGKHKLLAEERLLSAYPSALVCRMPLMFGNPGPCSQTFIQPWLSTLRSGGQLKLFIDEWRTNVSGSVAAEGLLLAAGTNLSGILHLGGSERISRYDFGLMLAEIFELNNDSILAFKQSEVKMAAPRPRDVSMDSSRAFSMGYNPPSIAKQLADVKEDMNCQHLNVGKNPAGHNPRRETGEVRL